LQTPSQSALLLQRFEPTEQMLAGPADTHFRQSSLVMQQPLIAAAPSLHDFAHAVCSSAGFDQHAPSGPYCIFAAE
jgi:hypothetical protein